MNLQATLTAQLENLKAQQEVLEAQLSAAQTTECDTDKLEKLARAVNLEIAREDLSLQEINNQIDSFFTVIKIDGEYYVRCASIRFDAVKYQEETGAAYTYDEMDRIKLKAYFDLELSIRDTYKS